MLNFFIIYEILIFKRIFIDLQLIKGFHELQKNHN